MAKNTSLVAFDDEYNKWVQSIKERYQTAQVMAKVAVNRGLIEFYWSLGQDIAEKEAEKKYGSEFFDRLSQDMKREFDNCTGFSTRNLRYS